MCCTLLYVISLCQVVTHSVLILIFQTFARFKLFKWLYLFLTHSSCWKNCLESQVGTLHWGTLYYYKHTNVQMTIYELGHQTIANSCLKKKCQMALIACKIYVLHICKIGKIKWIWTNKKDICNGVAVAFELFVSCLLDLCQYNGHSSILWIDLRFLWL